MSFAELQPFVASTSELFQTMLDCTLKPGAATLEKRQSHHLDIVGLIGLSGTAQAAVALRLPEKTALAVVGRFTGSPCDTVDANLTDGVGELVNIIAGGAKAKMTGQRLELSLPSVFRGDLCTMTNYPNPRWVEIPFTCDLGEFSLSVALRTFHTDSKEMTHESVSSR